MELYRLAETCEYGDLKEEMIWDWLVVGINNQAMSECLQLVADLTLKTVKKMVCQSEAVREQVSVLKGETGSGSLLEELHYNSLRG